jgi:hypothetical protein
MKQGSGNGLDWALEGFTLACLPLQNRLKRTVLVNAPGHCI